MDGYFVYSDATKTTLLACSSAAPSELVIPNSVTRIEMNAFWNLDKLTSVTIPSSVTHIRPSAFESCTGLTFVEIPESVTNIDNRAFAYCHNLTSISYTGKVSQWNSITKGSDWRSETPLNVVQCSDGIVNL